MCGVLSCACVCDVRWRVHVCELWWCVVMCVWCVCDVWCVVMCLCLMCGVLTLCVCVWCAVVCACVLCSVLSCACVYVMYGGVCVWCTMCGGMCMCVCVLCGVQWHVVMCMSIWSILCCMVMHQQTNTATKPVMIDLRKHTSPNSIWSELVIQTLNSAAVTVRAAPSSNSLQHIYTHPSNHRINI